MKIVVRGLVVALACLVFIGRVDAAKSPSPSPAQTAIAPPVPPDQLALHDQLLATLSPPAKAWVADESAKARKNARLTEGNIRADIQTRFTGQSLADADKNILLFIVLTETVRDMSNDLSDMVNGFKSKHNATGGSFTISLTPEETTQLETTVLRRTQLMTAMTALMKKLAGSQGEVVGNLQ